MWSGFDQYASLYDAWFLENTNVLMSELRLVARTLTGSRHILSIGCGSGLFEKLLKEQYGIIVEDGIEPSSEMAAIAVKRGMNVTVSDAESAEFKPEAYDTILFNGSPGYIDDLASVLHKVYVALPEGGKVILIDVPKESSYGILYNLAMTLGSWDDPLLAGCFPPNPYPIELVKTARWRTTASKVKMLEDAGFKNLEYCQTLTTHPIASNEVIEDPQDGCDKGDYVAVIAYK